MASLLIPFGTCAALQAGASVRDYGAVGDGRADDSRAFRAAAAALSSGAIAALRIPAGSYRLASGPFDVNGAPGPVSIEGAGAATTRIVTERGASQYPFIIRNSVHGTRVSGLTITCNAPPATYQHGLVLANVSNLVVEDNVLEGAQGYGLGIFEDVVSQPNIRSACNDIVVRNNQISDASQYGIQHFPKVASRNAVFHGNRVTNCGRNTQGLSVPTVLLPSAMKVGQATAETRVYDNMIVGAPNAAALDLGNWEDIEVYGNTVTNSVRQFVAISVGRHPQLAPYVASHRRCVVRDNIFVHQAQAGARAAPMLTFASDAATPIGAVEIARNRMRGDTVGRPASFDIKPGGTLRGVRIVGNVWEDVAPSPAIVILLSTAFGGRIVDPVIEDNQLTNRRGPQQVLRGVQLEGVAGARIVGNSFTGMGENVLDLRNSEGRTLIERNVVDGYNLANVPGAAVVAIIDGAAAADYQITDNIVRRGGGPPGVLVGGGRRVARLRTSGNSLEGVVER